MVLESQQVTVKSGHAELSGPHQVVLSNGGQREVIEADAMILATGSKSRALPNILPDGEKIITSDEALKIKKMPKEMVIIGGGYIGIEFATFFSALGSKVTIVEILESILPGLEGELVRNLRRVMERDGVRILTESKIEEIRTEKEGLKLAVRTSQGIERILAEKVLLSVGRGPNVEFDFSKTGVDVSASGIRVNRRMETTAPGVYALGDATGGLMLAHVASEEAVVAAENIMGIDREMRENPVPLCVFTYPEIASVGLTEKEAKTKGAIKVGRFPFRSNPTAVISGETEGLIKVVVGQENDKILGVHIIGHEASNLISIASSLMSQSVKASEFYEVIQAHPTTPGALKEAFLDADGLAIHLPRPLRGITKGRA